MRKIFVIMLLLILAAQVAFADSTSVTADSKITAVTVYPSRAMVTRTASLNMQPGEYKVVFEGLPPEMVHGSLRVSGSGDTGFSLGAVETRVVHSDVSANPKVKELEARLEGLNREVTVIKTDIELAKARAKMYSDISMNSTGAWSKELATGSPSVEEWKQVAEFVTNGHAEAVKSQTGLGDQLKKVQDEITLVNRQLAELRSSSGKSTNTATIEVVAEKKGSLTLELGYLVDGANWSPYYEARVDRKAEKLGIVYQAKVVQVTSEDWTGVELSMSTARPSVGAAPPEVDPWYIDYVDPARFAKAAYYSNSLQSMPEDMAAQAYEVDNIPTGGAPPRPAARMFADTVSDSGTFATFRVATRQDIPADGSAHTVNMASLGYETLYRYLSVPKFSPYAYLKGFFTNDAGVPLLAGPVAVFHGDDYIGLSYLKAAAEGQKVELALGVDEGIKVKRERVEMFEEDSGMLSDKRRINYRYRVRVENFKDAAQTVAVIDQLPVSQREEVKVKEVRIEPEPAVRKDGGVFKWEFELGPGEKAEAWLEFYVEFPKDYQLIGIE